MPIPYSELSNLHKGQHLSFQIGEGPGRIEAIVSVIETRITSVLVKIVKVIHNGTYSEFNVGGEHAVGADYLSEITFKASKVVVAYPETKDWVMVWAEDKSYYLRRCYPLDENHSYCIVHAKEFGDVKVVWNNDLMTIS